ncbi:unnamed protein product [Ranitomeya imitator]|uniref:IRS-type PTB domain-containing protein n=1 Tax=Ranitomeya imitator TaxID=111125 RepID=A0ABN9LS83_9NEOB|nr:unnamed protein product [Ranitomeya imitator]
MFNLRPFHLQIYRRCWLVLRKSSSKGPWRLEKYPDERSVLLRMSPKVNATGKAFYQELWSVSSRIHTEGLFCIIELEAEEWYKALSMGCPGTNLNECHLGEPDLLTPGVQSEQTERFNVFLLPSSNLDVYGECKMQITEENLYLWDPHTPRSKLLSWPLCALRRYGSDASNASHLRLNGKERCMAVHRNSRPPQLADRAVSDTCGLQWKSSRPHRLQIEENLASQHPWLADRRVPKPCGLQLEELPGHRGLQQIEGFPSPVACSRLQVEEILARTACR